MQFLVFYLLYYGESFYFGRGYQLQSVFFAMVLLTLLFMMFLYIEGINNKYAKGIRRAHKIHHKNINKEGGECFGMLFVPKRYFQ